MSLCIKTRLSAQPLLQITHDFHKKSCALGFILKVRVFGTRKWPITVRFPRVGTRKRLPGGEFKNDIQPCGETWTFLHSQQALTHGRTCGTLRVHQNFCDRLNQVFYAFLYFSPNDQCMPCTNPTWLFGWLSSSKECIFSSQNAHLCDYLFHDVVEGIYSFNTICGAASVRKTNSQKKFYKLS